MSHAQVGEGVKQQTIYRLVSVGYVRAAERHRCCHDAERRAYRLSLFVAALLLRQDKDDFLREIVSDNSHRRW